MTPFPSILLSTCVIVIILAPIFLAVIAAFAIAELARSWRNARAVIRQTEDEYAEVDAHVASVLALLCTLCRDDGHGRCTCPANCGWDGCTYDHTTLSMLSREDQAYLRRYGISEGDR